MPFVGRVKPPKTKRRGCLTPTWTGWIRANTLWKCKKCDTVYRLSKEEWAAHSVEVKWVAHEIGTKPRCT
jgi:hypothetical protein